MTENKNEMLRLKIAMEKLQVKKRSNNVEVGIGNEVVIQKTIARVKIQPRRVQFFKAVPGLRKLVPGWRQVASIPLKMSSLGLNFPPTFLNFPLIVFRR